MQVRSAAQALLRRRSDGKYLVLTSSEWKENPLRSHSPDLPGGMIEPNEQIVDGLVREISEEIGVNLKGDSLELIYGTTYIEEMFDRSITHLVYFAEVDDIEIELSWEHESFDWLTGQELKIIDIRAPYPTVFKHLSQLKILKN